MKKSLTEEIKRIQNLLYTITEQEKDLNIKVKDDPKTADYVSSDLDEFYSNLKTAAETGGLSQQSRKTMTFQKGVESMQIGLILLGYQLPKHGVDGLFGPETANAVKEFKNDFLNKLNESSSKLRSTINQLGYDEKGGEISSGGEITDEISQITSDILSDFKKIKPDVKVVVTAGNDKYHKKLGYNSKHKTGNAIDVVLQPYNTENAKAFIGILNKYKTTNPKFSYIDEYTNPSKSSTGGHFHLEFGGNSNVDTTIKTKTFETATPEMLEILISELKKRNITSNDITKYIDKFDMTDLTNQNYYVKLLENIGAPVSEENLKFLYAWRQAEGKGGKFNPFNTTQPMPGAVTINSHGVKSYQTLEDGMVATIKTLKNGKYNCIIDGLLNDIGADNIAKCQSLKTWGTGDLVVKVLSGYNKGSKPKVSPLA